VQDYSVGDMREGLSNDHTSSVCCVFSGDETYVKLHLIQVAVSSRMLRELEPTNPRF